MNAPTPDLARALRMVMLAGVSSVALAIVKIATGMVGQSSALVADGIESLTDVVGSIAVLVGLTISVKPPDADHPYGHGKVETLATLIVASSLLLAAALIAWQSISGIVTPQEVPAWFTLPVLAAVVVVKVFVARAVARSAVQAGSTAMEADAWHHFSDAITSGAAFAGISVAMIGGPAWAAADDWAALFACSVILKNGIDVAIGGLRELLESQADPELERQLRAVAAAVPRVRNIEKLRVRKSGMGYIMDIHVHVDGDLPVREGHAISGAVKAALLRASLRVIDVTVHVEPADE